jgi:isoquinoline 1-oxidoreductase subunit alpha
LVTFILKINGTTHTVDVEGDMPLLWALRDILSMTGTKFGCGVGLCGACTVHIDGQAARSCQTPVSAVSSRTITTIEGLSADGRHPVQEAWMDESVSQCGYCQVGHIMTAAALLTRNPTPSDADIDTAFANVLCRCGTYQRIRRAVHRASGAER